MLISPARTERSCQNLFLLTGQTQLSRRGGVSSLQTSRQKLFISFFPPLFFHPVLLNSGEVAGHFRTLREREGLKFCERGQLTFFFPPPAPHTSSGYLATFSVCKYKDTGAHTAIRADGRSTPPRRAPGEGGRREGEEEEGGGDHTFIYL